MADDAPSKTQLLARRDEKALVDEGRSVLEDRRDLLAHMLVEQLRLILYFAFSSQGLPWAIHSAHAENDWTPLVTMARSPSCHPATPGPTAVTVPTRW